MNLSLEEIKYKCRVSIVTVRNGIASYTWVTSNS